MRRVSIPYKIDRLSLTTTSTHNGIVAFLAVLLLLSVGDSVGGRFAVGSFGTIALSGYIPAAIAAVDRESERLRQERDAFDRFATEVESLSVSGENTNGPTPVAARTVSKNGLRNVRNAYRSTVMEIDHFESEYGERLYENMSIELGEDVAAAVVDGNQFNHLVKQAVIQQSIAARSRRKSLLETIAAERDYLERSRNRIRESERRFEDNCDPSGLSLTQLFRYERSLRRRETRCERLLDERQRHVHSNRTSRSKSDKSFLQSYLYASLDVDFPVLYTLVERYKKLRERRRVIQQELIYR